MTHIVPIDDWTFEPTQVRCRKNNGIHNEPYTAIANISFINQEPYMEGLLSSNKITRKDYKTLTSYLSSKGFTYFYRMRDGIREKVYITNKSVDP